MCVCVCVKYFDHLMWIEEVEGFAGSLLICKCLVVSSFNIHFLLYRMKLQFLNISSLFSYMASKCPKIIMYALAPRSQTKCKYFIHFGKSWKVK